MKLLFDESLSYKLCPLLSDLYPNSAHVRAFSLTKSSDWEIWQHAKLAEFVIVTTDGDYSELTTKFGPPPKVIWLRRWAYPTKDVERLLRKQAIRIAEFVSDPDLGLLSLEKDRS